MVGDYDGDSLFDEKLDLLLRSVRVGTNIDLETRECRLRGLLIDGMSHERDGWRQGRVVWLTTGDFHRGFLR